MANQLKIGIAGATGLVGSEIVQLLKEKHLSTSLRLFGSDDTSGEVYDVGEGSEAIVETLTESALKELDVLFFAAGRTMGERFIPVALEGGAVVIDASGFVNEVLKGSVVVPEVNPGVIRADRKAYATPTSTAGVLAEVLSVLNQLGGLSRVFVATYQGVSGAGKYALDELWDQVVAVCNQRDINVEHLPAQIAFNCIPEVDGIVEGGHTREELRSVAHLREILSLPKLDIDISTVRVPMLHGIGLAVSVVPQRPVNLSEFAAKLSSNARFELTDPLASYRVPLEAVGQNEIFVGRIREGTGVPASLSWWMSADNLRKGSALNMVEIFEKIIPSLQ